MKAKKHHHCGWCHRTDGTYIVTGQSDARMFKVGIDVVLPRG
jgi:hypothetical protein